MRVYRLTPTPSFEQAASVEKVAKIEKMIKFAKIERIVKIEKIVADFVKLDFVFVAKVVKIEKEDVL